VLDNRHPRARQSSSSCSTIVILVLVTRINTSTAVRLTLVTSTRVTVRGCEGAMINVRRYVGHFAARYHPLRLTLKGDVA
jgi:hypothetical protein